MPESGQAVFELADLPPELLAPLGLDEAGRARFRQLILIGHLGRDFWAALQRRGMHGAHPVDQFVTERVAACPAGALASDSSGPWRLPACLEHRKQPGSSCQDRCLARNACPLGARYRYSDEQIAYHYLHSLRFIRERY